VTAPVFFTDLGAPLTGGTVVVLSGDEAHHAAAAFRVSPGEVIEVVNGSGLRAIGTAMAVTANRVEVAVDRVVTETPPARAITLVQALAKHKRDEQAVSQAVELGVDRIIPWQAERSVVRWPPAKAGAGRARWAALAKSAAKVARRAFLPPVEPLATTNQLISRLATQPTGQPASQPTGLGTCQQPEPPTVFQAGQGQPDEPERAGEPKAAPGQAVVVLHEDASQSLPAWYAQWSASAEPSTGIVLLVGPEGGIDDLEIEALQEGLGAAIVGLGPFVLRSSTAGPAALAALSALTGRW